MLFRSYGFYDVRLREGLRRQVAPTDSLFEGDSLMTDPMEGDMDEEGGDGFGNFFRRLFKKDKTDENRTDDTEPAVQPDRRNPARPDAIPGEVAPTDTVKTRRQLRQERRERKRRERDEQALPEDGG